MKFINKQAMDSIKASNWFKQFISTKY